MTLNLTREGVHVVAEALAQYIENSNDPEERTEDETRKLELAGVILDSLDVDLALPAEDAFADDVNGWRGKASTK